MARIQSKTTGRKMKCVRINPREFREKAEAALVKLGTPSKRWTSGLAGGKAKLETQN